MRNGWKLAVTSLLGVALVGAGGCGSGSADGDSSGGKAPATVAIGDSGASSTPDSPAPNSDKPTQDPLHPIVSLDTSLGKITVQLDAEKAPLTVDNFLYYVQNGFYDQTIFHEAVPDNVILGGGYTADLVEKKARTPIRNEAHNGLKNTRGTVAMVRQPDSIDSATCQFFFNLSDHPHLDYQARAADKYGYCVFGHVVEGMDVVEKIGQVQVEDKPNFPNKPVKTVMIKSARRIR
jgi:peptidyl-prolyl cis-trans isomerase A (cyclophilin A)